jgi:NADPH:quinone reductase-like Zn-dependent oxidoreductase
MAIERINGLLLDIRGGPFTSVWSLPSSTTEVKPMKIVVIGGTGLIGSKTVAILRQRGHVVVAASTPSPARASKTSWPARRW